MTKACQRSIFSRSCIRIAEEVQLQAEEEWIVDALKQIKQQRNCLQIERLHLESLKAKLTQQGVSGGKSEAEKKRQECNEIVSAVNMMKPTLGNMRQESDPMDDDALCNDEELNLMVSRPVFDMPQQQDDSFDYMSDEEDDDDDDDGDNVMIDMNMFMNGNSPFSD